VCVGLLLCLVCLLCLPACLSVCLTDGLPIPPVPRKPTTNTTLHIDQSSHPPSNSKPNPQTTTTHPPIHRKPNTHPSSTVNQTPTHPRGPKSQAPTHKPTPHPNPTNSFYGNVPIGAGGLPFPKLQPLYDVVILAYGASEDRRLGIPGEDLQGVLGARAFVNWYNGHPDYAADKDKGESGGLTALLRAVLTEGGGGKGAVVLGQGNVALDCARVLAKRAEDLAGTDICRHALDVLACSRVGEVSVVGRRGHGQAAFTIKELRELTRIDGAVCVVEPGEIAAGLTDFTVRELEASRPRRRLAELVQSLPARAAAGVDGQGQRQQRTTVALRFLLMPRAVLPDPKDPRRVGGLLLERTRLEQDGAGRAVAVPTGEEVTLPCRLVLRSIGYKSLPIPGVPFDARRAVVPNRGGRVVASAAADAPLVPGLYCTGWVKRGPTGIINTNIVDARETVAAILEDAAQGRLPAPVAPPTVSVVDLVEGEGKGRTGVVTWEGYRRIDAFERAEGEKVGKPREKVVDAGELVRLASGGGD
jgi:NADPH-dependent glutamate synthase beta subunit-like oxidoreductase